MYQLSNVTLGGVLSTVAELRGLLDVVSPSVDLAAAAQRLGVSNVTLGALQGVVLSVSGVLNDSECGRCVSGDQVEAAAGFF